MKQRDLLDFARQEMMNPNETLHRAEPVGPFVVALVELEAGGYQNRVAQPAAIQQGRPAKTPLLATVATYGPSRYKQAARRFNSLVDDELA